MKDKLLTYGFIILMVFTLFSFSWPVIRDVVVTQVEKIDDNIPEVSIN